MLTRIQTAAGCFVVLALLCFLGPYLDDLDARQATADTVADRQQEAGLLALAERQQHPSTTTPPRRRHCYPTSEGDCQ